MTSDSSSTRPSKAALWTGWFLCVVVGLMLLAGGVTNVLKPEFAVKGAAEMGYPESSLVPLGVVTILSALAYLIPRTAVLGAILLTGYLGGAVATHVIHKDPPGAVLLPVIVGAVVWTGLVLRDPLLRGRIFFRR